MVRESEHIRAGSLVAEEGDNGVCIIFGDVFDSALTISWPNLDIVESELAV